MSGILGHLSWSELGIAARLAGVSMMEGTPQFTFSNYLLAGHVLSQQPRGRRPYGTALDRRKDSSFCGSTAGSDVDGAVT